MKKGFYLFILSLTILFSSVSLSSNTEGVTDELINEVIYHPNDEQHPGIN
ncbi:hypothetical protein [Paraliobacillus zengyii]|nr:hypothetical protein [Paraliobacillus zengyii]